MNLFLANWKRKVASTFVLTIIMVVGGLIIDPAYLNNPIGEGSLGVVAAERCSKEQLKHQNGVEGDAAGDVLRGRLAIGESPKQRRCAFAQSGQTRCRNC